VQLITSLKLLPGSAFGTDPCITTMTALQPTEVWVLDFRAFLVILTVFTDEVRQRGAPSLSQHSDRTHVWRLAH
jgi:CRP-like cAMP-binding protein